jgi:hypothetical protein
MLKMSSLLITDFVALYSAVVTTAGTNYKAGTAANTKDSLTEANNFFANMEYGNKNFRKDQGTGQLRNAGPSAITIIMNPNDINICNSLVASGLFNSSD